MKSSEKSNAKITSIRIVLVGDGNVGKTSILVSYTSNNFSEVYEPTVFDTYDTQTKVNGTMINLTLGDTAGQQEFSGFKRISYAQADAFIIVFSVVEEQSFQNAMDHVKYQSIKYKIKWYKDVMQYTPHIPVVFFGNKIDLLTQLNFTKNYRHILNDQGCLYFECSAKAQHGLKYAFDETIKQVLMKKGIFRTTFSTDNSRMSVEQCQKDDDDISFKLCKLI